MCGSVEGCLKVGGCCRRSPAGNRAEAEGLTYAFSPRPLHTAMYCLTALSVGFGKYRARRLIRRLRRPGDANSFLLREHMLASSYGD